MGEWFQLLLKQYDMDEKYNFMDKIIQLWTKCALLDDKFHFMDKTAQFIVTLYRMRIPEQYFVNIDSRILELVSATVLHLVCVPSMIKNFTLFTQRKQGLVQAVSSAGDTSNPHQFVMS